MSRVRPGVLLTNANRFPVSALMALDLPVFDRPTKAISPTLAGASASEATLLKKQALRKRDIESGRPVLLEYQPFEQGSRREKGMKRALALLSFAVCAGPLAAVEPAAKADSAK